MPTMIIISVMAILPTMMRGSPGLVVIIFIGIIITFMSYKSGRLIISSVTIVFNASIAIPKPFIFWVGVNLTIPETIYLII